MRKSIALLSTLVLLLPGLSGCSKQAPPPVLSIANEKSSDQMPMEPPQGFKDLWAEANPLPDWINPGKGGKAKSPYDPLSSQQTKSVNEPMNTFDEIKLTGYLGILNQDANLGVKVTLEPEPTVNLYGFGFSH
jgi:hypothetical protein